MPRPPKRDFPINFDEDDPDSGMDQPMNFPEILFRQVDRINIAEYMGDQGAFIRATQGLFNILQPHHKRHSFWRAKRALEKEKDIKLIKVDPARRAQFLANYDAEYWSKMRGHLMELLYDLGYAGRKKVVWKPSKDDVEDETITVDEIETEAVEPVKEVVK